MSYKFTATYVKPAGAGFRTYDAEFAYTVEDVEDCGAASLSEEEGEEAIVLAVHAGVDLFVYEHAVRGKVVRALGFDENGWMHGEGDPEVWESNLGATDVTRIERIDVEAAAKAIEGHFGLKIPH